MKALPTISLLGGLMIGACGGNDVTADASVGDGGETQAVLRAQTLASLGTQVVLPSYQAFATEAGALVTALSSYEGNPSNANLDTARAAWRDAMLAWQKAELVQFGPLAAMTTDQQGGEDIRDEIYAWPLDNRCSADQLTVSDDFATPAVLAERPINTRGLGIIEYLLYADPADNSCSALANINQNGTWASFSASEITNRRAAQAAALAGIIKAEADALVARWDASEFMLELTDPTRPGALYGSAQEGLSAISDAMFYLDKETKDMKLGGPLGITCDAGDTCPELLESQFANISKDLIVANLQAFQELFHGGPIDGPEPGFKELLESMGATGFAEQMSTDIATAITMVESIPGDLAGSLDGSEAAAAHAAVVQVINNLKGMFVGVLDFEIPDRAAGDDD